MWTLPLLSTLVFTTMVSAHYGGALSSKARTYCGRDAADLLAILCYDEMDVGKRAEGNYNNLEPYFKEQLRELNWPWISMHKARALAMPSKNKRYSGIADECCVKPCSIDELMSYC